MKNIFDLFIIGGGINGAGIARDAAGRGLKVCLADKGEIGGATSSWSTKLIHGGLRYLENYEFKLVKESLKEREVILNIASSITDPIPFIIPHSKKLRPQWLIKIGLLLYDYLGGKTIIPKSKTICGALGVKVSVTEFGPPDKIIPFGLSSVIFDSAMSHGRISE